MEEKLHYKMTIKLWKDDKVFGPGICQLLTKIEETGSMHQAAARMGLAYSKAWKMMKTAEEGLGFALTERVSGGRSGGETRKPGGVQQIGSGGLPGSAGSEDLTAAGEEQGNTGKDQSLFSVCAELSSVHEICSAGSKRVGNPDDLQYSGTADQSRRGIDAADGSL